MHLLDHSLVAADEIDSLGHMNVRFYGTRVARANARLMTDYGLDRDRRKALGVALTAVDTYRRYRHEQFKDAALEVHGGVLDATPEAIKLFYEIRNPQKGETAATFIVDYALKDLATRASVPFAAELLRRAQAESIALPDYGAPRSLSLDPPRLDVTFEAIERKLAQAGESGMMGGRFERTIEAEDCDAYGFLRAGEDPMFPSRLFAERRASGEFGPPVLKTDAGHRFAWAWMETREVQVSRPRAGDVLRQIGAELSLQRKTRRSRRWIFNLTRGEMVSLDDILAIALDLDARKAIEIPAEMRARLEQGCVPEFA
ncbi:MAG: bifunctional 3-hydroxyacyl-CoA dehydrogenase/thioesterase [Phenylobacterium sp.]|nr:bifunctional 3-hydroxyacyl-CoA dehydrogenase/thioesterase [Phenylobacterium sp.]